MTESETITPEPTDVVTVTPTHPGSHASFLHIAAQKAATYRAILKIFFAAKEHFEIALRASEVRDRLAALSVTPPGVETVIDVTQCLGALCEWGNLSATRDVVSARTISEYLHPDYLYQLTHAGDMAERAIIFYEDGLVRPGELSASALHDIADTLKELDEILALSDLDEAKAVHALMYLGERFETLVERAQMFVGNLQRELDRRAIEESAFLALKEELLNYLQRFVKELVSTTHRINESLRLLDAFDMEPLLHAAAQAELAETLSPSPALRARTFEKWQGRWAGLRGWFIGTAEHPAHAQSLRDRALDAIPTLLERVRRMHDQRANRADRATDFTTLARWFAGAPANNDLHCLWRAAFALTSSRHLRVNATTLEAWKALDDDARPSWENCPPYIITIAQWKRGKPAPRGAPPGIIDRAKARAALREKAAAEANALHAARAALAARTPCALGNLPELDEPGFEILLDAIGEAFAQIAPRDTAGEATTADGGLLVRIELPAPRAELASIHTTEGILRGPDMRLTLRLTDEHPAA